MNERVPMTFLRKPIYVCFLVERSDGRLVDFRRIRYDQATFDFQILTISSSRKLNNGQEILLTVELLSNTQYITSYVMCDEIGKLLPLQAWVGLPTEFQRSWYNAIRRVEI